ncbi:MAG: hypothetical protein N2C14_28610 [Planctomycetales bacterium]
MITANRSLPTRPDFQQFQRRFMTTIYPVVQRHARLQFRNCCSDHREEWVQEAIASAWRSCVRLLERGKDPAKFPSRIAHYAVLFVRNGRRVGGQQSTRDVMNWRRQQETGCEVESLEDHPVDSGMPWREILTEDKRTTPAEVAAMRLDSAAWLRGLPVRNRRVAKAMLGGDSTAARKCLAIGTAR